MKLQIEKSQLNLATNRAQGAISDRTLAQIGLKADNQSLSLSSTDRVLAIYSTLPCDVSEPGIAFVPGKLFSDVIKQSPEGVIELSTSESFLIIRVKGATEFTMKIPLLEDVTWKEPPSFKTSNAATINCADLSYMTEQVQFCIEQESPRNYGAVGYLHKPEKGKLRLVGTDGYRLSYCDVEMDLPDNFLKSGICLSKRALAEIYRMTNEGHENMTLVISDDETTILAQTDQYMIFARLSAVKYPNYRGVLPMASLNPVILSRPNLQSVTKRVLLAADKTNALRLRFSDGSLTLSSRTVGSSESKESLPLAGYRGTDSELSINGRFLTDVFSTIPSDELTLQFKGEEDPIVIIPKQEPPRCKSMHVLVPIRENV